MSSKSSRKQPFEIAKYEVWAETSDVRLVVLTLARGEETPWHWHTEVSDTVFCMEGVVVIETRAPREHIELKPGMTHVIPPRRAHRVIGKNKGACKFAVFEGVGKYDFNPVGGGSQEAAKGI